MTAAVTADLYAPDGTTLLGALPNARGITFQHELSKAGSATFEIPLDDAAAVTDRCVVKFSWRGAVRFGCVIQSEKCTLAVDGRVWLRFDSQPGLLAMLGDAVIYPEYGLARVSAPDRRFGWMSADGPWLVPGDWTSPTEDSWASCPIKAGFPPVFGDVDPVASWIGAVNQSVNVAPSTVNYFRANLTVAADVNVAFYGCGDNFLDFYLDGEQVFQSDQSDPYGWRDSAYYLVALAAGPHQLAAKVTNAAFWGTARGDLVDVSSPLGLLISVVALTAGGNPSTVLLRSDNSWTVHATTPALGWARGDVLHTLIVEAQTRGVAGPSEITVDFDGLLDSRGDAWTDVGEYVLPVGTLGLDEVATQLSESYLDLDLDAATMTLHAWGRAGQDRTGAVELTVGGDLKAYETASDPNRRTRAVAQAGDGSWLEVVDSAAESAFGRIELGLTVGSGSVDRTVAAVLAQTLADSATPRISVTGESSTLTGAVPYVDYQLGDTITVPGHRGAGTMPARVLAITVDAAGETVRAWPELVSDPSA